MKEQKQKGECWEEYDAYNTRICPSDWRYSAAIVGLMDYFQFLEEKTFERHLYSYDAEYLYYNAESISREYYLKYAEKHFEEYMHHKFVENLISFPKELTQEQMKTVNEKLAANTICKKIFKNIKYKEDTKEQILALIEKNREQLVCETFRSAKSMYAKFANTNRLFSKEDKICRLVGFYVDLPKKSKSISYQWRFDTYVANDIPEFDFIPFAFSKSRDSYFINNNMSIKSLYATYKNLGQAIAKEENKTQVNPRSYLFRAVKNSTTFLNYDVEVIHKEPENDYFETMFVRKRAIQIFEKISEKQYGVLEKPCRIGKDQYLPVLEIVTDSIINLVDLDSLIEKLIKDNSQKTYLISILIAMNEHIYESRGVKVRGRTIQARETAYKVRTGLMQRKAENKIKAYQQKLISAITFKDYNRFCEILLQLSAYVEIPFDFAYDLFDDFENNKNLAYSFVEGLSGKRKDAEESKEKNSQE